MINLLPKRLPSIIGTVYQPESRRKLEFKNWSSILHDRRNRLTAFDMKDRDYASVKRNRHDQTLPRLDERHLLARRILRPPAIGFIQ